MKEHQRKHSHSNKLSHCCSCNEDRVRKELEQLRTHTEKALKASWDETEMLQKECNQRLHGMIRLEVELELMKQNECASRMRINDLEGKKQDLLLRLSKNTANKKTDENKHKKRTWPLFVSLPAFKGISEEESATCSEQIKVLGQKVLERDMEIMEKQRILEESMEMVKQISMGDFAW